MKMNLSRLWLSLAICLVSCTSTPTGDAPQVARDNRAPAVASTSETASETAQGNNTAVDEAGVNLLVSVHGIIQLKRREWADYYRTDFGSLLHAGDLLQVGADSNAVILCNGLRTRQIPGGSPVGLNNICPPAEEAILVRSGVLVGNTRGGSDPFLPYIISPRKTKLFTMTPMLRWNPVPGATSYTVTVKGEGVDWQTTVTEPSVAYPGQPSLVRGQTYAVVVQADTGASSQDEGVQGIGFTLVDAPAAARVEANMAKIMALELDAEGKELALGQYLVGEGLFSEGIEILETLTSEMRDSPFPYRMLGDLYRQSGLNLLAQADFETAVALADTGENLEAGALAREGFAEVALSLGDRDYAATLLQEAIELYQLLGDDAQVTTLTERMEAYGL